MQRILRVGIFIFEDVETLDFCGPLEVFSAASIANEKALFEVFTFAKELKPIRSINGLSVNPDYELQNLPEVDILVIPGGNGTRALIQDKTLLQYLYAIYQNSQYTFSVCSGARIPAIWGVLDDQMFTTHHLVFDDVQNLAPQARPRKDLRFTDSGKILTSAGVAAGIDLALYLTGKIFGQAAMETTARYMEYPLDGVYHCSNILQSS